MPDLFSGSYLEGSVYWKRHLQYWPCSAMLGKKHPELLGLVLKTRVAKTTNPTCSHKEKKNTFQGFPTPKTCLFNKRYVCCSFSPPCLTIKTWARTFHMWNIYLHLAQIYDTWKNRFHTWSIWAKSKWSILELCNWITV